MSEAPTAQPIRLKMGADVPEWLIVAEPGEPGAPRGNFRFACDVEVFESPAYFVVVPQVLGAHGPAIDTSGTVNHRVYAPGKPVRVITADEIFFPLEVNAWHQGVVGMPPVATQPAPTVVFPPSEGGPVELPESYAPQVLKVPRWSFWNRLRWAFLGR